MLTDKEERFLAMLGDFPSMTLEPINSAVLEALQGASVEEIGGMVLRWLVEGFHAAHEAQSGMRGGDQRLAGTEAFPLTWYVAGPAFHPRSAGLSAFGNRGGFLCWRADRIQARASNLGFFRVVEDEAG